MRVHAAAQAGCLALALAVPAAAAAAGREPGRYEAEAARLAPDRVEVVAQDSFPSQQGVALRPEMRASEAVHEGAPDLVFRVRVPRPGRYWIRTHAAVDASTAEAMRKASSKRASLRLTIAVPAHRPANRVVFTPWSPPGSCTQALGKFDFDGSEQEVRVWLPAGVRLDFLQLTAYTPPKVPPAAEAYRPAVAPPRSRPRVWVNEQSLPVVRARLEQGENAPVWAQVRKQAAAPFAFAAKPDAEVEFSAGLEQAAAAKAFVHLMTGDPVPGREAVALARGYLSAVAFDNLLDITREIGRAIYTGALVYDWCYGLMTPEDRDAIRGNLMRLAGDMEIGWPPFLQGIVNGHGNEAQLNRDLLAMAIAIYDEDPVPYRYCSYRILEELVPMRRFEYQSPRHNQGVSYGPYRFSWDLHAAWLFRRMAGRPVFDDNIGNVYSFWLHMRLPGGQMLRDGDGFSDGRPAYLGATPLLAYAYTSDPVIKGDLQRQGGLKGEPILFLLLNDPGVPAEPSLDSLPLVKDFGPVLGSMIARTGWDLGPDSDDVVVEMKGGGYHFGNHQHADAGSFQIFHRGLLAGDLGQYGFYGTPYDSNFNKRSIAHSLMLVVDPGEKFQLPSNDGGSRPVRACPSTPEQAVKDPLFANGAIISASCGPDPRRPQFGYFAVDLTSAYSRKIREYVRTFCFLHLDSPDTPAALIVADNLTAAEPGFRKYWQINTLNPPEKTPDGVILRSGDPGRGGKVSVRMLLPRPDERELQVLSGDRANSVFGEPFTPPHPDKPEAKGHRILFSPATAQASDVFLTVMPIAGATAAELPLSLAETPGIYAVTIGGRVVVLSRTGKLIEKPFRVAVPPGPGQPLLLCGLAPGAWVVCRRNAGGETEEWRGESCSGRNTAYVRVPAGDYEVRPLRSN